jgi:hypothetical protein
LTLLLNSTVFTLVEQTDNKSRQEAEELPVGASDYSHCMAGQDRTVTIWLQIAFTIPALGSMLATTLCCVRRTWSKNRIQDGGQQQQHHQQQQHVWRVHNRIHWHRRIGNDTKCLDDVPVAFLMDIGLASLETPNRPHLLSAETPL